jgi:hypothetical protein
VRVEQLGDGDYLKIAPEGAPQVSGSKSLGPKRRSVIAQPFVYGRSDAIIIYNMRMQMATGKCVKGM